MWGLKLSEIGFGSWLTFNDGNQDLADQLHRTAYECGINFFDTANGYGDGVTEGIVGQALKPFRRETYVLATKLFWPQPDWPFPGANDRGLSRKHIFEMCDLSLRRLGVDYIDLYQCHRYDDQTPLLETCRAMNDLMVQGKILYWGVSEWNADQIEDAVVLCDDHGWQRPVSNQPLYNMLERHWERGVFETCRRFGMGIAGFSPLAEGALTGKYLEGIPSDSRANDEHLGQFIKPRLNERNAAIIGKLAEVAAGLEVPLSNLALAWCLRQPVVTSTIIGASRPQQIHENCKASDLELGEAVLEHIEAILEG
jgi:aryl-alcohol dehydrogenase-like predicted oxidoreductase